MGIRVAASSAALWALTLAACAGGPGAGEAGRPASDGRAEVAEATLPARHAVAASTAFRRAVARGTRSPTGEPGPLYWQQSASYDLRARLWPDRRRLEGRARITYRNDSPDTLRSLWVHLIQNVHAAGALRNEAHEVTGGVELRRVGVDGTNLAADPEEGAAGYRVDGTVMEVRPPEPLPPGGSAELEVDWTFVVPEQGAGGRMGRSGDDLYFLAYWYPQMAVYDDVVGWHVDPFLGTAEFYMGFARYRVTLEVPDGWVVRATGTLQNPEEVLSDAVRERLAAAAESDSVVRILGPDDFLPGRTTRRSSTGWLTWRFEADSVRDFAFSATRRSLWDAVGVHVGAGASAAGDGPAGRVRAEALYRESAPLWREVAAYSRHALDFHSRYTGVPYPWPHMTAVEGGGIIGGGMEFPMMTLMGDYNARGDSALYYVTSHELAHMWVPMIVATDEKRRGWMDEGMTTFLENQSRKEFFPGNPSDSLEALAYLQLAGHEREGEMMRWTDYQYPGAGGVASYAKPATVLVALRGLLGEDVFHEAYRTFHAEWAFRHPTPWDFFHTFERVSGRDLGWFWRTWYHETWTLDHAIESVTATSEGTRIVVEDRGEAPMPTRIRVTRVGGETLDLEVPVERWLAGARRDTLLVPPGPPVVRVQIDPEGVFPDVDRQNDVWVR